MSTNGIPLFDLGLQHAEVADEVAAGFAEVLASAAFVGGPAVGDFERVFAEFSGVAHCVGVANGTDALELALRACGIGRGDEVVLPANTFVATAEAVARAGATPVLVDVDKDCLLLDPEPPSAAVVTERTRAVVPVHLFGQTAPVEQLEPSVVAERGAAVVEDAAQSQGARRHGAHAGLGRPRRRHQLLPRQEPRRVRRRRRRPHRRRRPARSVRLLGEPRQRRRSTCTSSSASTRRLDTLQAVVLRAKLARLDGWNDQRRAAADRYDELLADVEGVRTPAPLEGNVDVWHLYVVRVPTATRARSG